MAKYRTAIEILSQMQHEKRMNELYRNINSVPDFDYIGKECKINMDKYTNKEELSVEFLNFLNENKDTIFITEQAYKADGNKWLNMYSFVGVDGWVFNQNCLLAKCERCNEFIDYNIYRCKHCGKLYLEKENIK